MLITGLPDDNMGTNIAARPYVSYTDANGNARTHYYTETGDSKTGSAYYTNYNAVYNSLNPSAS